MSDLPHILRLSDAFSQRSVALRLSAEDASLPLSHLIFRYLKCLDGPDLLAREAIAQESLVTLQSLQDLVYACDDLGRLTEPYSGVSFRQDDARIEVGEIPGYSEIAVDGSSAKLTEIVIDRTDAGNDRNWAGFHRRRWNNAPGFFEEFVLDSLEKVFGPGEAGQILQLESQESILALVETLARKIWDSEFENYSRFTGRKLLFKTGDETVRNIAAGAGGICTEKVQALKFLTDHYGIQSEYVIGGDGARDPVPVERLREMLRTGDFRFARRHMRYWQHSALIYQIDGLPLLVDATNGNIPFLFLKGSEAERLLGYERKPSVPVRMVEAEEEYFYHRVPQDIPQNLFFAMESWITDTDMVQVFENELGLFLSSDYYVTPLPYRTQAEYQRLADEYQAIAARAGYRCQANPRWTLDGEPGEAFCKSHPETASRILDAREHLLLRYNGWDIPGHDAGLVVMEMA
ncbi:MAG: hypothetical protein OXN21_00290 [Chloroflexota bacterium]|nr:hypothetical protein [Chloroflexota bacterium]